MKFSSKILHTLFLLILIIRCTDDPNSIGGGLIPDEDKLKYKVIDTNEEDFEQMFNSFNIDSITYGTSTRIFLGQFDNIKTDLLISFLISLPDSIKTGYKDETIILKDSWIDMLPDYWLGDSTNFNFTAHKIKEHWNSVTFNKDSLDAVSNTAGPNILTDFEYNAATDTTIKFKIDSNLVKNWIVNSYDDKQFNNYGIILKPLSNKGIAGFQGLTTNPSSRYPLLYLVFKKGSATPDTIIAKPKLDIHYPIGEAVANPPQEILLQGQFEVRGKLKIDVSNLPKDILINSAILELTLDENETIEGTKQTNFLDVKPLSSYENVEFDYDSTKFSFLNYSYQLKRSKNTFSGDIKRIVQGWMDDFPNEGLELRLTDANSNISKLSFYGSDNSNKALRPKLKIFYTYR
ncbi:MAG: hypothetical protein CR986_07220 [Ignavibacteriae bacterium]|nr:MAG: hypothetical protein CR986_07220 [Ignavibacteriota bacterium]